jgi:hypothetical protein
MKIRFSRPEIAVRVVATEADRAAALAVVDEVYREEKRWIASTEAEIAESPAERPNTFWLLARSGGTSVGVMRVVVDPELAIPAALEPRFEPGFDPESLARRGRFAEVGRMMVRPEFRRQPRIVLELMRAALAEALGRGVTHFVTAVFEDDPHSPYGFHVRQLGFERIGTHERGELACGSRRILLVLDLARAYERLGRGGVARELARGLESRLGSTSGGREREAGAILPEAVAVS